MNDTKLFITNRIPDTPVVFLVSSYLKETHVMGNVLFLDTLPPDFSYNHFSFVENPNEADYFLFPHAVSEKKSPLFAEVERAKHAAVQHRKPLIAFAGGDLSHDIFIDGAVVFKGSQYGYMKRDNELIMPYFIEDLSLFRPITIRKKTAAKPVVGFCGWAGFATPVLYLKYLIWNAVLDLLSLLPSLPHLAVHKRGVYWRRKAMDLLSRDSRFDTQFIRRTSFSGSKKTITLDPETARKEYLDNLYDCDLALSPKGDASVTYRFYESLSLGRVQIVVDTDMAFPLQETIDYDSFILRVSYKDIDRIGDIVAGFWENLSEEEFAAMQKAARDAFTNYLRHDKFFSCVFISPEFKKALASLS